MNKLYDVYTYNEKGALVGYSVHTMEEECKVYNIPFSYEQTVQEPVPTEHLCRQSLKKRKQRQDRHRINTDTEDKQDLSITQTSGKFSPVAQKIASI